MSKEEKLMNRFLSFPTDFSYGELKAVLKIFGFKAVKTGKTGGSWVRFSNPETGEKFTAHKPHPNNTVKRYVLEELYDLLKKGGSLK